MWYCVECGSSDLEAIQPSADESGRTATAVCRSCCNPRAVQGRPGAISTRRVGISHVKPEPHEKLAPIKSREQKPEALGI